MDTWSYFRGLCFFGSQTVLPWDSAGSQCLINQALLANQVDWPLQYFLTVYLNNKAPREAQNYWIGLSTDVNKDWKWTDGIGSYFWATQLLRNVNESASASAAMARLYNWRWIPSRQTAWFNWICQRRPLFCSSPAVPKNGGIMLSNQIYKIGSSAYYYCIYGFVIVGRSVRICLENGTWSDLPPTCERKYSVIAWRVKFNVTFEYKCSFGKAVQGNSTRVCMADGTWSGGVPTCADVECGVPPPIENGKFFLTSNSSAISNTAQYSCDKGYRLVGISVLNCGPNGLWSPAVAPLCYGSSTFQVYPSSNHNERQRCYQRL
ncbi:unnamed protein product [Soboliphyme baturini]|uniref:Sushi, von Willebrand factor type A, EGF and pentraxin domain-containing protein 1 n=1 Tax=Soboliphyme baturini TaxID=241478 RepID=A0A183IB91_9BILA|nr:unnamed protein product [Soboliphyme baturini]